MKFYITSLELYHLAHKYYIFNFILDILNKKEKSIESNNFYSNLGHVCNIKLEICTEY